MKNGFIEVQRMIDLDDSWYDHTVIRLKDAAGNVLFSRKYWDDYDGFEVDVDIAAIARYMAEDLDCELVELPTEFRTLTSYFDEEFDIKLL
jgi:hypothetical protein